MVHLHKHRTVIAVHYVGQDGGVADAVPEVVGGGDIVDAPAFVFFAHAGEALVPPCIMMWIRIDVAESIHKSAGQKIIKPGSFCRQEAGCVFVAFRVVEVDFLVRYVVIATQDQLASLAAQTFQVLI